MSTPKIDCYRCGTQMQIGFARSMAGPSVYIGQWIEGRPLLQRFLGWSVGKRVVKVPKNAQSFPIATFRCPACGLLESYAKPEFEPK